MASLNSILKTVLDLNGNFMHVNPRDIEIVKETVRFHGEEHQRIRMNVHASIYKAKQKICPVCGRKCSGYDHKYEEEAAIRATNLAGIPVYICYRPARIYCPDCQRVLTEWIPWADGSSRFTAGFNDEVSWLVCRMSKTDIATYEGINWRTVGNCVKASLARLEPDVSCRLHDGLRRICVDEVSYKAGQNYITVVFDMERNRVVWIHKDHGLEVFRKFCEELSEEERAAIEIVAGDGAKWIDTCTGKYFPNATRCIDPYHVVAWTNEALDKVRINTSAKASAALTRQENAFRKSADREEKAAQEAWGMLESLLEENHAGAGSWQDAVAAYLYAWQQMGTKPLKPAKSRGRRARRRQLPPEQQKILDSLSGNAKTVKGSKHALGHNPENCTEKQTERLKIIENSFPDLYRAYQLKETLRLILHMTDHVQAEEELDRWIDEAAACGLAPFEKLSEKISHYRQAILDSIKHQANSARSEATNATIKLLVRMARGFRCLDNLIALIYLKCSDIVIPLSNRAQMSAEKALALRKAANEARKEREKAKIG